MGFGLIFSFIIMIFLALSEYTTSEQQCTLIKDSVFRACSVAGYNKTFRVPFELSDKNKIWINNFLSWMIKLPKKNCSVALMGEVITCSVYAPSCTEGNPNPNLPCRRVCSEFLKKCQGNMDPFWIERYIGLCTLLPNKTASSGQCFEPPGFDKYHNATTKGLLESKCNRVVFPWCKGLGYDHTIVTESTQIITYEWCYGKNFTNDSTIDKDSGNKSLISFWNEHLRNYSNCAVEIRKLICADLFPPCFPEEGLAFYTICKSVCKSIEKKCVGISESSPLGKYITYCEELASGDSSHGFCKHISWPKPIQWVSFFRDNSRPLTPSKSPSTSVIVAAVVVPLIVIGLVVLGVVLWRQRKLPWVIRLLRQADDTKGFVKVEPET